MSEYIEIGQLWKCDTCYHNDIYGCALGLGCDHGENYRPAYSKLKKADVAPVVHGRWIPIKVPTVIELLGIKEMVVRFIRCSKCHMEFDISCEWYSHYCPNCGARMGDS